MYCGESFQCIDGSCNIRSVITIHANRARVLEHWLRIAGECHEINNFSSLYSIFCGINSTPVFRLKKTWALVNDALVEMFEVFSVLFAPQKNSINFAIH